VIFVGRNREDLLEPLLSSIADEERRPTTVADTSLPEAAIQEIRRRLSLWPNLGPDDCIRLGLYVLSEDALAKAWAAARLGNV
jgi:hypothetical protein